MFCSLRTPILPLCAGNVPARISVPASGLPQAYTRPLRLQAPSAARQRTADELAELLAQRFEQTKDLSESELERSVDEAIRVVRRSYSGQR